MTLDCTLDGQATPVATSCRDATSPGNTIITEQPFFFSFAKRWSEIYDDDSIPNEDRPYVEELGLLQLEPKRGSVELFVRPYEDDFISPRLKTIIQLYGSMKMTGLGDPNKQTIWLDDRNYGAYHPKSSASTHTPGHGDVGLVPLPNLDAWISQSEGKINQDTGTSPNSDPIRDSTSQSASARYSPASRCPNLPLTAKMLYKWLLQKRFNLKNLPDSDRRLIFILNPDGHDFVALIETAVCHQHEALRDVIAKYHAFRPSMGISLSTKGLPSYQFNFHLPFFAMRRNALHTKRTNVKPRREWIDLSFVAQVLPETTDVGELGLYPAQISFTICGTSIKQYVAYGFEDAEFDPDREFGEEEFSRDEKHADQMTKGEEDANFPIWDPREYFLLLLGCRSRQVREEWEQFVLTLEDAFGMRISHPLRWHHRLLDVLRETLPVLKAILKVWETFLGANGDYHHFSDSTAKSNASKFPTMLHNINKEFDELKQLHNTLSRIQEQCKEEETSTGARMMQQNNYIAVLMLQWLGPLGLVISFFDIEKPIVKFEHNLGSFIGFNLALMLLILFVRVAVEGNMYRPRWCDSFVEQAKRKWKEDRPMTKETTGSTVIQRRWTLS